MTLNGFKNILNFGSKKIFVKQSMYQMNYQQIIIQYYCIVMASQYKTSSIIEEENERILYKGRWIGMKYVDFTIGDHIVKNYQKIFRTTSKPNQIDGVDMIPIITYKHKKPQLVMIVEFRPPVKGYTLEFPTGMTQSNNYEENACRQLKEETGYIANSIIKTPMPAVYCDPWKSSQDSVIYIIKIDGDDPKCKGEQSLEADENIMVVKFQINDSLLETVVNFAKLNKLHLEAKVYAVCLGIWLKNNLGSFI